MARMTDGAPPLPAKEEAAMIKFKKILYPTDFSESSLEALRYAVSLAKDYKAKLILMHVINEQIFSEGLNLPRVSAPEALGQEMEAEAGRQLRMLIPADQRQGLDSEMVIRSGMPFLEVIRYAEANGVDLIVIGTHGRSGMEHIIFGSTAEKVLRKATCPVLSVRPPTANS
jgi:nucleotide-binding universal stress UspA family protein